MALTQANPKKKQPEQLPLLLPPARRYRLGGGLYRFPSKTGLFLYVSFANYSERVDRAAVVLGA